MAKALKVLTCTVGRTANADTSVDRNFVLSSTAGESVACRPTDPPSLHALSTRSVDVFSVGENKHERGRFFLRPTNQTKRQIVAVDRIQLQQHP